MQIANDVQPKLLELKTRLFTNRKTFQPVVVAVGPVTHIRNYYVVVNEQLYSIDTSLGAIYLALKIFFTLDCKYPENTQTIWAFVQRILLNIDLLSDVLTVDSNVILGHINNIFDS